MPQHDEEVHRAIGRIEGSQALILDKLNAIIGAQIKHEDDDKRSFTEVRLSILTSVKELNEARDEAIAPLAKDLANLQSDTNRAKGAGWVILGILTALVSFLGSAVIAVWSGHIKVH